MNSKTHHRLLPVIPLSLSAIAFALQGVASSDPHAHSADSHEVVTDVHANEDSHHGKPSPDAVIEMLKEGNARFYSGNSTFPHLGPERFFQAGTENQGRSCVCNRDHLLGFARPLSSCYLMPGSWIFSSFG